MPQRFLYRDSFHGASTSPANLNSLKLWTSTPELGVFSLLPSHRDADRRICWRCEVTNVHLKAGSTTPDRNRRQAEFDRLPGDHSCLCLCMRKQRSVLSPTSNGRASNGNRSNSHRAPCSQRRRRRRLGKEAEAQPDAFAGRRFQRHQLRVRSQASGLDACAGQRGCNEPRWDSPV